VVVAAAADAAAMLLPMLLLLLDIFILSLFVHSCILKLEMVRGKKQSRLKNVFLYFLEFLVGLGWVGLAGVTCLFFRYVCPFLYSQTGGKKNRANKKISSLFFGVLGLGWVGLALWGGTCLFFRYVCLLAFSNWRWFEEN